jgi:hypothetical protein
VAGIIQICLRVKEISRPEAWIDEAQPEGEVSTLLRAWTDGDRDALDALTPIVYDDLRRLARRYVRGEREGPRS